MSKNEMAIVISRCMPSSGIGDNEFQQMPCYKRSGKNGNEYRLIQLTETKSLGCCFNTSENIIWVNGYNFVSVFPEFHEILKAPGKDHNYNILAGDFLHLIQEIGYKTEIEKHNKIVLIIHTGGGSREKEYYKELWEKLHAIFSLAGITCILRFATTDLKYSLIDLDRYKTDRKIPHTLAGLQEHQSIPDAKIIRNWINTLKEGGNFDTLFDRSIDFEKSILSAHGKTAEQLLADLKKLGEKLGKPFNEPKYEQWLNDFFCYRSDANSSTETYKIDKAIVIKSENDKYISEIAISSREPIFQAIKNTVPEPIGSQCNIVYLSLEVLRKGHFDYTYLFRETDAEPIRPTIFITLFDIVNIPEEDETTDELLQMLHREIVLRLFGRFRFFDSSIWFRLVPIFADKARRESVFSDIERALNRKLYCIPQSFEARDLLIRAFNQSYVRKKENNISHGERVTPWLFHSEYQSKTKINEFSIRPFFEKLRWNFLLVDDQAETPMTNVDNSKYELISVILKEYMPPVIFKALYFQHCERVVNVDDAISLLQKAGNKSSNDKWPDVILLDYLLFKNDTSEFSDKIISTIQRDNNFEAGPLGKLCFFPITMYAQALYSKLREAGIQIYSDKFIVTNGADPICTPNLFTQNLLDILNIQVKELYKTAGLPEELQNIHPVFYHFDKLCESAEIKQNAMMQFPKIVQLHAFYQRIKEWYEKSTFANTIYESIFKNIASYELEHFRDVVYQLAFGSINDKKKLWGEWTILKEIIERLAESDRKERLKEIINNIEKYISEL